MSVLQGLGAVLNGSSPVHGSATPNPQPVGGGGTPFSGIFKAMAHETGELSDKAQQAVTGLLSGSGVDVHEAMIASQKADIAFELALQVRNKAVGAYQQMMAMQF